MQKLLLVAGSVAMCLLLSGCGSPASCTGDFGPGLSGKDVECPGIAAPCCAVYTKARDAKKGKDTMEGLQAAMKILQEVPEKCTSADEIARAKCALPEVALAEIIDPKAELLPSVS